MKYPFTKVPNIVIRSEKLDVYDKAIFNCIESCNPSFPSYTTLMKWTGMSRTRVCKSLKNLEQLKVISRYKSGKKIIYETHFTSCPELPIPGQLVAYDYRIGSPELP